MAINSVLFLNLNFDREPSNVQNTVKRFIVSVSFFYTACQFLDVFFAIDDTAQKKAEETNKFSNLKKPKRCCQYLGT